MALYLCESCEHGYSITLDSCSWCGASNTFAHISHSFSAVDTECYYNYWLCRFSTGEVFELHPHTELDVKGLRKALSRYTCYTFNGIGYDIPMIAYALTGASCYRLKQHSDSIIQGYTKWWDCPKLEWVDHVDLMPVAPGDGSLKMYGGKLHTHSIQDLPYDPGSVLEWYEIINLRNYCGVDCQLVLELREALSNDLELRQAMSETYGIDLRSKSGPQIAEAIYKRKGFYKPAKVSNVFNYMPPNYIKFNRLNIDKLLASITFELEPSGYVKLPPLPPVMIAGKLYTLGIGGLHSTESAQVIVGTPEYFLTDFDVASYYPATIINNGIAPSHVKDKFLADYIEMRDKRVQLKGAKDAKSKADADGFKLMLNGIFGKLLDPYSVFYDPEQGLRVTLTGQLSILMLIESLEDNDISVVSANTDGIVVHCPVNLIETRDNILANWQRVTGYTLEDTPYKAIYSRDVNSYIAIKHDGSIKTKGVFALDSKNSSCWTAPSNDIAVIAVIEYLKNGTPITHTVKQYGDLRKFVTLRKVTGGAYFLKGEYYPKVIGKRETARIEAETGNDYATLLRKQQARMQYIGKTVRFYHSIDGGILLTSAGHKVPVAEGVTHVQEYPLDFPNNVDYQWYINAAYDLLKDIGYE